MSNKVDVVSAMPEDGGCCGIGSVIEPIDRVRILPRFCRLYDFVKIPGLFLEASAPSQATLKNWREEGVVVMCRIGRSEFVDVHMTFKKNHIRLGVLR